MTGRKKSLLLIDNSLPYTNKTYTTALAMSPFVKHIFVVRDMPGLKAAKVQYHCPPPFFLKTSFAKLLAKFMQSLYISILKKPDIVYGVHLYFHGIVAFIIGKLTRKFVVVSVIAGEMETRRFGDFLEPLFLWVLRHVNLVLVTGEQTRQYLQRKGVPPDQIEVIPSVIDTKRFAHARGKKHFDLVTHCRLTDTKNIPTLLQVVRVLKEEKPDITLGIAGEGPLRTVWERMAAKLGLNGHVSFLGFRDAPSFLQAGRIYVLTSKHEGLPLAMLEAMSSGLPCVVPNVGDIIDVAQDGINAFIIPHFNDIEQYKQAISNLLRNKKLYQTMSKNALKVRRSHDIKNANEMWKPVLSRLFTEW